MNAAIDAQAVDVRIVLSCAVSFTGIYEMSSMLLSEICPAYKSPYEGRRKSRMPHN